MTYTDTCCKRTSEVFIHCLGYPCAIMFFLVRIHIDGEGKGAELPWPTACHVASRTALSGKAPLDPHPYS